MYIHVHRSRYLTMREKMMDTDVAAGIKLWHSKQSVYHLGKDLMHELEVTIKGMQAKSFDVAVGNCLRPPLGYSAVTFLHLYRADPAACMLITAALYRHGEL